MYQKVCRMCRVAVFVLRAVAFLKFVIVADVIQSGWRIVNNSICTKLEHKSCLTLGVKHLVEENTQNGRTKYLQSM